MLVTELSGAATVASTWLSALHSAVHHLPNDALLEVQFHYAGKWRVAAGTEHGQIDHEPGVAERNDCIGSAGGIVGRGAGRVAGRAYAQERHRGPVHID